MEIREIKRQNRNAVYQFIRENGPVSKQEIVVKLNLSLPTVTQNLEYLEKEGLIDATGKLMRPGGRYPTGYSYIRNARIAIGLDITKHHIKCVAVDLSGNIIDLVYKKQLFERTEEYFKSLGEAVEEVVEKAGLDRKRILGVGIALQAIVDEINQKVVYAVLIDCNNMGLQDFARYIPYPVKLMHDADAAGYAEVWTRDIHDAFYVSLCSSVGGSVLIKDRVYYGDNWFSGEIGHMKLVPDGLECYCGQKGCMDAYCRTERLTKYADGSLELFFKKLEEGEKSVEAVWSSYMDYLSMAVSDIRMLFGCSIIIGGNVGAYMDEKRMDSLRQRVDSLSSFHGHLRERAEDYLLPCKYKIEAVGAGAAITFINDFLQNM